MNNNNPWILETATIQITYRQLVESMHEGLVILDPTGVIMYVNDQYCRMFGYEREELIGKRVTDILDHANQKLLKEHVAKRVQGGAKPYEMSVTHKAGHQVPIIVSPQPLVDSQGQVQGSFAIISNLSVHKEAEATLAKRAIELEAVTEVAAAASTNLDTTELLHAVVNLTKERFGLYHTHIYLLNEAEDTLSLIAGAGSAGQEMVRQQWQIPLANQQSIVARVAHTRQGIIVSNVQESQYWLPNPLLPDTRSELAVPLIVGSRLLGVLDVQSDTVEAFGEEDVRVHTALAAQVAVALQNATLYAEVTQRAAEMETLSTLLDKRISELNCLNDIGREMLDNPPAAQLLQWVAQRIPAAMQYPALCRVAITLEEQIYGQPEALSLAQQMTQGLRVAGKVMGYIYVAYTEKHDVLNEESALLGGIASRLSSFLENRQLFRQAQQRATHLETLGQVSRRLSAVLDPKQLIAEVVEQLTSTFKYYYTQIYLFDDNQENLVLAGGSGEVGRQLMLRNHYLPKTRGLVGRAAAQNSIVLAPDVQRHIGVELISQDNLQEVYRRETDPAFEADWYAQHMAQLFSDIDTHARDEKPLQLGYVYRDNSDFFGMIKRGVEAAARDLHVEVEVVTSNNDGQHGPLFEAMVKQGKDGLVTVPDDPTWIKRINDALNGGIPVVTCNRELTNSPALAHIGQDNFQSGTVLAGELVKLLQKASYQSGKILVGSIVPDRQAGLAHGLRSSPYTLVTLERFVSQVDQQADLDQKAWFQQVLIQLEAYWEQAVADHPDLVATVGLVEPETYLMAAVKHRQAGQWLVAGYDLHPKTLDAIKEGLVQIAIGQHPYLQGYLPIMALVEHIRCGKSLKGWIIDGWLPNALLPKTRSEVAVPIAMGNQILGVLDVQHNVASSFSPEDINLLQSVADQVGVALQTAHLYQQAQQRAQREQLLREVTARIRGSTDVDTVMRTAAQEVGRVLGRQSFVYLGGQTNGPLTPPIDMANDTPEVSASKMSDSAASTVKTSRPGQTEKEEQHER